jgi:transcription antitermination factor NusG
MVHRRWHGDRVGQRGLGRTKSELLGLALAGSKRGSSRKILLGVKWRSSMQTETQHEEVQCSGSAPCWCAIHTRYQHETLVEQLLQRKGFETFNPTFKNIHQWRDRKKEIEEALFPGYLFIANLGDQRLPVLTTPGVCSIVSFAGIPAVIPDDEIESIRRAIASPYRVEPHSYLREGDQACVRFGPLAGLKGIFVRKGKSSRLVLTVEMLGRAAAVEIEESYVEPLIQPQQGNELHKVAAAL